MGRIEVVIKARSQRSILWEPCFFLQKIAKTMSLDSDWNLLLL